MVYKITIRISTPMTNEVNVHKVDADSRTDAITSVMSEYAKQNLPAELLECTKIIN